MDESMNQSLNEKDMKMHPCESHLALRSASTFSTLKSTNNCAVTSTHHSPPPPLSHHSSAYIESPLPQTPATDTNAE